MINLSKKLLVLAYFGAFLVSLVAFAWHIFGDDDVTMTLNGGGKTSGILNYVVADHPEISSITLSPFASFDAPAGKGGSGVNLAQGVSLPGISSHKAVAVFGVIPPNVAVLNVGGKIQATKSGEETPAGVLGEVNESGVWIGQTFYEYKKM